MKLRIVANILEKNHFLYFDYSNLVPNFNFFGNKKEILENTLYIVYSSTFFNLF